MSNNLLYSIHFLTNNLSELRDEPIVIINPNNNRAFLTSNAKSVKNAALIAQKIHTQGYEVQLK